MKVMFADSVLIALRNISQDDRNKIRVWFGYLERWESDPFAREHSRKLEGGENVYMLVTSTEVRIFFRLEKETITILDVANQSTIVRSGQITGG